MHGDAADPVSQQRMQTLGFLASGVAHDLNNLLQMVIGTAESALDRIPPEAATSGDLRDICAYAGQGASLLKQILRFGRPGAADPEWVAVDTALERAACLLRPGLPVRTLLQVDSTHPRLFVRIDPVQLDQVILNLALNARDAMPQGGTLRMGSHLHRQEDGRPHAAIDVSDTGGGIPPALQDMIFRPFFTTRGGGNGGLGLAIVADIVHAAGGRIVLESGEGRGTLFRVLLPCTVAAPA